MSDNRIEIAYSMVDDGMKVFKEDVVKEKIQNAHKRLRTELYLPVDSGSKIDKIFKEEFGDDLL